MQRCRPWIFQHIDIAFHCTLCITKLFKLRRALTFLIFFIILSFFRKYHLLYRCVLPDGQVVVAKKAFVKTMAVDLSVREVLFYLLRKTADLSWVSLVFHHIVINNKLVLFSSDGLQMAKLHLLVKLAHGYPRLNGAVGQAFGLFFKNRIYLFFYWDSFPV